MGIAKFGQVAIFGPALRFADMREEGITKVMIHIGGDSFHEMVLTGDEDREFRQMFADGPSAGMMQGGSEMKQ